jgi:adenylate cyclase
MSAAAGQGAVPRLSLDSPRLLHDLRTPLNAVIGYSEMWLETLEPEAPPVKKLRQIVDGGNRLLGMMNDRLNPQIIKIAGDRQAHAERVSEKLRSVVVAVHALVDELIEDAKKNAAPDDYRRDLELILASACRYEALLDELAAGDAGVAQPASSARTPMRMPSVALINSAAQEIGHLLVVEDNAINRELLCRRLVAQGHQVTEAGGGEAALALLHEQSFDMVLLDVLMPGIDGYQVLERIKADEKLKDMPVVAISALNDTASVVRCIQRGAEDYLHKPIDPVLLKARVESCLGKKRMRERELVYLQQLSAERERSEELLLNVLPRPIAERLKEGEKLIVDRFPDVTVLFFDLVGFSSLAAKVSPTQLVEQLNGLFCAFDVLTAKLGVEKIKTIGDGYMAVGGLPIANERHHVRVAELALEMARTVSELNATHDGTLSYRIGMHSGPVVAGVIGTWKFSYDLWGDTVNVASRMESHSLPGRIQVSAETRARLESEFTFESRGEIEVKGLGVKEAFFLVGPKPGRA